MTLECETRQPAKRVTWLKGMLELRSGRKYVIRQRGVVLSLTINCLEKSDADIYICDVGTMQSRAQLTVHGELSGALRVASAVAQKLNSGLSTRDFFLWFIERFTLNFFPR